MTPIIDVVTLDVNGEGTETETLLLFPMVPREEHGQFFVSVAQWHQEMTAFIDSLKPSQNGDQSAEVKPAFFEQSVWSEGEERTEGSL